jgi:putative CocE/NonD family hydrolase
MSLSLSPGTFDQIETAWIPMSDGVRLAARMWIPKSASQEPVPAILEYIPYRRRDGARERDDQSYAYLAAHGYACIRLDIRGSGDSEGIIEDEYLPQEQHDAVEAIGWIASQPWCSGAVGMVGISWGGFNALQVAARRPAALRAILTVCSTDDRYADDMHYMGGAHLTGNLEWGSTFFSIMARAPDPLVVGEGWRAQWLERLRAVRPVVGTWLKHQRRDAYWKQGSVCEDIGAITCPVLAVGGWVDGYSNAVFRLLRDLDVPRLGIVGPWGHKYPNLGVPGPAIGYLAEARRWWDHWLKGIDTGIMQEPMLRAYVQDWIDPASHHDLRPGRWVGEQSWPSPGIVKRSWCINARGLGAQPEEGLALSISSPQTTGAAGGEWCPYSLGGIGPELPLDQRRDDAFSLVFDAAPLTAPLEILGAAMLDLTLFADQPIIHLIARLSDVAPDGQVARVTYGVLNLSHRSGHESPEPLEPGRRYNVTLALNDAGYRFGTGHRVRVAISTCYWPIVWPAPKPGRLSIVPGSSRLSLPVRAAAQPEKPVAFAAASGGLAPRKVLQPGAVHRTLAIDVGSGIERIEVLRDDCRALIEEIGVETGFRKILRYRIHPADPSMARAEADYELIHRHAHGWDTTVRTRSAIGCTAEYYLLEADLEAFEGEERIFSRSWSERIPRDFT